MRGRGLWRETCGPSRHKVDYRSAGRDVSNSSRIKLVSETLRAQAVRVVTTVRGRNERQTQA